MRAKHDSLAAYLAATDTTQAELAARVGVEQGTISRILNGHRTPSLKLALLLAREASVPVESLYTAGQE